MLGRILITIVLGFLVMNGSQETVPLPANLIFTTGEDDLKANVLAYVDAETHEISSFYVDHEAALVRALSWSPEARLLAVYRVLLSGTSQVDLQQLCLVDEFGRVKTCFEEMLDKDVPSGERGQYQITWSDDGSRVYFVSSSKTGSHSGVQRLVEADIESGTVLRTIFEHPYVDEPPSALSWTTDLRYVLIGVGTSWQARKEYDLRIRLLDLQTGEHVDIPRVISDDGISLDYVCPGFSPLDSYFVANMSYSSVHPDPGNLNIFGPFGMLAVFDKEGTLHQIIGEPGLYGPLLVSCPVWTADEEALYFVGTTYEEGYSNHIFKYSLREQALEIYHDIDSSSFHYLALAPDEVSIAYEWPFWGRSEIVIVLPSGTTYHIREPFPFSEYSVWVSDMR